MAYVFFNSNPRGKYVGDCVIRAISKILDEDWEQTYVMLTLQGYIMSDMPSANHVWGAFLQSQGFERYAIPNTCPNCYTVADFCRDNPLGDFILATGSHVIAVRDGDYYDSWDSGMEVPIYHFRR